ncbi:MAG TPA: response regulator, partial [Verrucomicrobiota bacterium]|nr:response regulator [Verrucomicrobiota bacterium]
LCGCGGESPLKCVILDLTMPEVGGRDAFLEIRRMRADVPVIVTSGYSEQDVVAQFAGATLAGFVHKPYRFTELADKLRAALGG